MSRRRLGRWLLVLPALLVTGCGIDAEPDAHRIAPDDVPFELLGDPPTAPTATQVGQSATVFLVGDDRLVPVQRSIRSTATVADLVGLIADGPTEPERALGLGSALPEGQIVSVDVARGMAQVDLAETFAELNARDQARAIAQLTYTLTGRPGVGRVGFTLDGASTEVPTGDGTLTADAVAREDFKAVAPEP